MQFRSQISSSKFSAFGCGLKEREFSGEKYRYGFNSMEKDDELKGEGNSYDFGSRMYDNRLGRWLSMDKLYFEYYSHSTYSFVNNQVLIAIDPSGNNIYYVVDGVAYEVTSTDLENINDPNLKEAVELTIATKDGAALFNKYASGGELASTTDIYISVKHQGLDFAESKDGIVENKRYGVTKKAFINADGKQEFSTKGDVHERFSQFNKEGVIQDNNKDVYGIVINSREMQNNSLYNLETGAGPHQNAETVYHELLHVLLWDSADSHTEMGWVTSKDKDGNEVSYIEKDSKLDKFLRQEKSNLSKQRSKLIKEKIGKVQPDGTVFGYDSAEYTTINNKIKAIEKYINENVKETPKK